MNVGSTETAPTAALDNDVVIKAISYGLVSSFWPSEVIARGVGVLGVARFVLRQRLEQAALQRDLSAVLSDLDDVLSRVLELQPTEAETALAAEFEAAAQQSNLEIHLGESQLASIVITRRIERLDTGDKRAVRSFEALAIELESLAILAGRLRCLEQIVRVSLVDAESPDSIIEAVCAEPAVDKALTFCFACVSESKPPLAAILEGLDSYISELRADARRMLVA